MKGEKTIKRCCSKGIREDCECYQEGKEQARQGVLKLIDKCNTTKCYTTKRDKEAKFGRKEGRDIVIEQICIEELKQKIGKRKNERRKNEEDKNRGHNRRAKR